MNVVLRQTQKILQVVYFITMLENDGIAIRQAVFLPLLETHFFNGWKFAERSDDDTTILQVNRNVATH